MVISKKMKIIGFSMLGVAITTIAIAVPLSLKKSDDEKALSVREKFVELTKKEIIINENNDLNLSILASQTKIINEIKKRTSFLNDTQKKSIKIKTKIGLVSYKEILKIEILITLDKKEETFSFKFKRMINNYDRFYELSQQNQILEKESENLDLSNSLKRDIAKKHLQKQASFLSEQEKKSIEIITNNKTISDSIIQIEVNATFFKNKTKFIFKFLRKESNAEKNKNKNLYDSLKAKFDQINLTQTLSDKIDLNLLNENDQNIVKNFIIKLINATASVDDVTNEEKKGITIDSTKATITHTNAVNVNISITFGSNTKTYIFKLTRTEKNIEKIATIKTKIKDTNLTIDKDVDTSDDTKILAAIKAQLKIDNPTLSNSDLAKITDNISSLTPGTNAIVILTITIELASDTISITINRPLSDAESVTKAKEAINSLSTKEIMISSTSGTITTNKIAILNSLKALNGYSTLDLKGSTISIKDAATTLTPSGVSFIIVITKNSASTEITSGFTIRRAPKDMTKDMRIFIDYLASKINKSTHNKRFQITFNGNLNPSQSSDRNIIKQFIINKINELNPNNELSFYEKSIFIHGHPSFPNLNTKIITNTEYINYFFSFAPYGKKNISITTSTLLKVKS